MTEANIVCLHQNFLIQFDGLPSRNFMYSLPSPGCSRPGMRGDCPGFSPYIMWLGSGGDRGDTVQYQGLILIRLQPFISTKTLINRSAVVGSAILYRLQIWIPCGNQGFDSDFNPR